MDEKTFELLKDWVEAVIDKKIQDAFGRDGLHESIRRREFETELKARLLSNHISSHFG